MANDQLMVMLNQHQKLMEEIMKKQESYLQEQRNGLDTLERLRREVVDGKNEKCLIS
jgi:hypothetical protein